MKRTREQGEPEAAQDGITVTAPPNHYGMLREYRCRHCGRLLFRAVLAPGSRVQTVCWHNSCKALQTVSVPPCAAGSIIAVGGAQP